MSRALTNTNVEYEHMQPRLQRLSQFIGEPLFESTLWGHEYDLTHLDDGLEKRIRSGQFKKMVFYGMGCSSVVSDIVKGFFITKNIPIHVEVVNDYDYEWFSDSQSIADEDTLKFIVCYSGWSVEPCLFYDKMKEISADKNLIVLSGGGKISKLAREDGNSVIQYNLRHADREYPLYHVQQFFSIFLDLFYKLGITRESYQNDLEDSVSFLKKTFDDKKKQEAFEIAKKLQNSRIVLLATARWYVQLLKQTTMFFNEIAMVPTHRNMLHEFSHTEVATYSNPAQKQSVIVFLDEDDDEYTHTKVETLGKLFGDKSQPQNDNIEFVKVTLDQKDFFQKFYYAHFFMVYVAYYLGQMSNVSGRDLISIAAKNPWWCKDSIDEHPSCVDIPGDLSKEIQHSIELV